MPAALATCLAFDTATEHLSIALLAHGRTWSYEGPGGAQASTTLLPAIQVLLSEAGIVLHDLDAIAFGRGPGAFTGLRTACSVAQGLALGADKPVLPVDSLLCVAEDARGLAAPDRADDVWVTMDARMGEIYAAHAVFEDGHWRSVVEPWLCTPQTLNARWRERPPRAVAGSALAVFGDQLDTAAADRFPQALPRASAMLSLAADLWLRGAAVDAALALPHYVRDKVAQTTAERAAVRALAEASTREAAAADGSVR